MLKLNDELKDQIKESYITIALILKANMDQFSTYQMGLVPYNMEIIKVALEILINDEIP